jgi:hypothetical protein
MRLFIEANIEFCGAGITDEWNLMEKLVLLVSK